ncbi:ATP-binding protein [Myroides phaeus]|uniref:ATP-binding protein n=1 Tax=Myroides phaeus TaxID=702745 RepID=UPI001E4B0869|nr:ATP-binding protein [Myroides phaeus]
MIKHFSIVDSKLGKVSSNLTDNCKECMDKCSSKGVTIENCPIYLEKNIRQGKITNNNGEFFLCSNDTKTTKVFREKLEALSYAALDIYSFVKILEEDIKKIEQKRVNRLIHNLTSLNAHNIQEIDDFIPQEFLTEKYNTIIDFIKKEIRTNQKEAALMFLRIAKHNIHMKTEFSIYKKLDRLDAVLDFNKHPIRKVILNVLHTFFIDFTNKKVRVNVEEFDGRVQIDYESIQVALYHLIENASKYSIPNSSVEISFTDTDNTTIVTFKMTSLYIDDDEVCTVFNEGYSGEVAKKCNLQGDGIGMWQIERMMKLNNGQIIFINGEKSVKLKGIDYAENIIELTFNKT